MHPLIDFNFSCPLSVSFDLPLFVQNILLEKQIEDGHFEFTFLDDAQMITLHDQYLNKPYSTDVITFNLGTQKKPIADIYICIDQARKQARDYGQDFESEIKLLMIHGILHCIGYDDVTDELKSIMDQEQQRLLLL